MATLAGINQHEGLINASDDLVKAIYQTLIGTLAPTDINLASVKIIMSNIPTSDPGVAGQLWANSAVLTISAG